MSAHVCIIGGSFNPIHYGHLRLAEEARSLLKADRAVFIPTAITPHKSPLDLATPKERLRMVELAIGGNPFFEASDTEIKRGGRSYTVETLKELGRTEKGARLTLVLGSDSFNDITTWHSFEELFTLASIAVVARPGHAFKTPGEVLPVELASLFCYDSQRAAFIGPSGHAVTYMETTRLDISSTDIRKKINEGASVRYLLPDAVIEYMATRGLYRQP